MTTKPTKRYCLVQNQVIEVYVHSDLENGMFLVSTSISKEKLFKVNQTDFQ